MSSFFSVSHYLSVYVVLTAAGMTSIGAVLALELEQEMYAKYVLSAPGAVKKEYNKKDYRQHYLMLMRNLKQKHNDPLVRIFVHFFF